jgi:hypothetical protein
MKQVRRFCAVSIIIATLSFPALAGDVHSPGITDPPPPADAQSVALAGVSGSSGAISTSDSTNFDAITALTIRLCEQLLLIF